ncbi:MAG: hypothetical protein HKN88_05700 [Gammaproteobacteria bacterium]|nr:hypothetical protein [Gammaproteobacteria bacterium]NNC97549.1 hypothetical protein [Gammaproteobacteria bacterium]NNM12824.1 hypothetical protein [Gammaproteobacteria bacterium]
MGFAYRPAWNDEWALPWHYTYLYDLRALSQRYSQTDQRANVFALEGIRGLNAR